MIKYLELGLLVLEDQRFRYLLNSIGKLAQSYIKENPEIVQLINTDAGGPFGRSTIKEKTIRVGVDFLPQKVLMTQPSRFLGKITRDEGVPHNNNNPPPRNQPGASTGHDSGSARIIRTTSNAAGESRILGEYEEFAPLLSGHRPSTDS